MRAHPELVKDVDDEGGVERTVIGRFGGRLSLVVALALKELMTRFRYSLSRNTRTLRTQSVLDAVTNYAGIGLRGRQSEPRRFSIAFGS
jgi:hypothetical protein